MMLVSSQKKYTDSALKRDGRLKITDSLHCSLREAKSLHLAMSARNWKVHHYLTIAKNFLNVLVGYFSGIVVTDSKEFKKSHAIIFRRTIVTVLDESRSSSLQCQIIAQFVVIHIVFSFLMYLALGEPVNIE